MLVLEPFPHVVIKNALDPALFEKLSHTFPPNSYVIGDKEVKQNTKYECASSKWSSDDQIDPVWRDFHEYHTSDAFYQQMVQIFEPIMLSKYPDLLHQLGGSLKNFKTAPENQLSDNTVYLDCRFNINTPVKTESSSRGPHIDIPNKLFTSLLYLPEANDNAVGGNLRLYNWKKGFEGHFQKNCFMIDDDKVEYFKEIPYEANTYALFLSTPNSIHGVSNRMPTPFSRRFVAMYAKYNKYLFAGKRPEKPNRKLNQFNKLFRRLLPLK